MTRDRLLLWLSLAFIAWFLGQYAKDSRWFAYIHESGHKWAAQQEGKHAAITSQYETTIYGSVSPTILVSGPWVELLVWSGVAIVLLIPAWKGLSGAASGFAMGFATEVYHLSQMTSDFARAGPEALVQWHFYGVLTLVVMYLTVGLRVWNWWRRSRGTSGSDSETK